MADYDMQVTDDYREVKIQGRRFKCITVRALRKFLDDVDPDRGVLFGQGLPGGAMGIDGVLGINCLDNNGLHDALVLLDCQATINSLEHDEKHFPGIAERAIKSLDGES